MWTDRADWMALIYSLMAMLGCGHEIGDVGVEATSTQGCIPMQVELVGQAQVQEDVRATYQWVIGDGVELHGERVTHTFTVPGTYEVALTVAGEKQRKTATTTIDVREAELPSLPGLYLRRGCQYQTLPQVAVKPVVRNLGKTSLKDLEKYVVGRPLSTSELVTHPLWRRDHTHTIHTVARSQFIRIDLMQFLTLGFVAIGEEVNRVALFRVLPSSEPSPDQNAAVVTQVIDSWGIENVGPDVKALRNQQVAPQVFHYMPEEKLPAGLYWIDFQIEGRATSGISPIELVVRAD